jgi:hypothetical protein
VLSDPRQTKVTELGVEFTIKENVAWFDISMQYVLATLVVEIMKGVA